MSFRLFIYYCAVCGGCAAYLGWMLGRLAATGDPVGEAGLKGLLLGMLLALGLSLVDASWSCSLKQFDRWGLRVLVAVLVGCLGGLIGGMIGQALYGHLQSPVFLILGWTITGLLIGVSLGVFDLLSRLIRQEDTSGARRKLVNGLLGGAVGGVLGGILFLLLKVSWTGIFHNKPADELWSPSATGFVALGMCIGLSIGLAQVILKEAWVRVEAGFRPGRELILSRPEITIGRAESCDIGLFGDPGIGRLHARILVEGDGYLLTDAGTPGGTFLNGKRLREPMILESGDEIRVGKSVLSFRERAKRGAG